MGGLLGASILDGFAAALSPEVLLAIVLAGAYGIFVGAIPGLTATMAVALFVPFAFFLDPVIALAAIISLEAMAIFAGDIPGALIRIPGTPSSAAYTDDAYALTRSGRGAQSLGISLVSSVLGGLFGAAALIAAAPLLARVAFHFTTFEYFWLALLGLSSAAVVARGSPLRGMASALLGLLLSTVGLDEVHGSPRFTMGSTDLAGGISFIPAMIGLFGMAEVLRGVMAPRQAALAPPVRGEGIFAPALRLLRARIPAFLRSSAVGTAIGILPGAGADIAAWVSYGISRRLSRKKDEYGRGSMEGIADGSAANNAALGGAWIPALIFGIPGDSITAIVVGILYMKGIRPGAAIFKSQPGLVESIYATFIIANLLLLPLGWLAIRLGGSVVRVPRRVLLPAVLAFCVVGAFSINSSLFDVGVMLAMGLLGYVLEARRFPVGPVVLGLVLGPMLEQNFLFSVIKSGGDFSEFFSRPVAGGLALATLLLWAAPALSALARRMLLPK